MNYSFNSRVRYSETGENGKQHAADDRRGNAEFFQKADAQPE